MADVLATISNLRIEDQSLAFDLYISGDPGGTARAITIVYDASGGEHERSLLGEMEVDRPWNAVVDLPASRLPDGDYGAWVFVSTTDADGKMGPEAEAGVSFMVGRGRIYASREQVEEPSTNAPPQLSWLRLEGSWITFDMTNPQAFDVEVEHRMSISTLDMTNEQKFDGRELVRAGATQQGHYLLPDHLADGRYMVVVNIQAAGSTNDVSTMADVESVGGVLTLVSTGL